MSILIKDMEMPKSCKTCNFCNEINFEGYLWFDFYCRAKDKSFDLNKNEDKPDWCPLIEVEFNEEQFNTMQNMLLKR